MSAAAPRPEVEAVPFLLTGQPQTALSRREREVADAIAAGLNVADSARLLRMTEATAKRHTWKIFQKTGLTTRTEIAVCRLRSQIEELRRQGTVYIFGGRTMNVTPEAVEALCQQFGPQIKVPAGINGPKLMLALSDNETSRGKNCTPRYEPAYDHGGYYGDHSPVCEMLDKKYGRAGACSYGPWQVLIASVPTYTPDELQNHPEIAAKATVEHLNNFVLGFRKAQTLEQIAEIYNSGCISKQPSQGVLRYVADLVNHYRSA